MERKKHFTVIVMLLAFSFLSANAQQHKKAIYKAYISNKMIDWKATIDSMQAETKKSDGFLLELINYQYGYIGWCLGNDDKKQAQTYLKLAESNVENLEKRAVYPSYVNAYKSAFYGYSIGLNKL